jgi:ATP-dependent HslUV protease subunit HslV
MFDVTSILAYKGKHKAVIGGDGQVTFGNSVLKCNATKSRTLNNGKNLAGFAGNTADAFNLFEMFKDYLTSRKDDIFKAVIDISKAWGKDKILSRFEAMMIVLNTKHIFILTGNGDVVEPEDGQIASIRSGGNFAISTARAIKRHVSDMDEELLVKESLIITPELCIYTKHNIKTLVLEENV